MPLVLIFWPALMFGLPALMVAVCVHACLPRSTGAVVAVLVVAALVGTEARLFYAFMDYSNPRPTPLEDVTVPSALIGIALGNLLAIPIARRLRSLFNVRTRQ